MPESLCLLTVHAHPDDESSKGAGTVARYHQEGVHTVLVCCTGGEEGEILNPAMDTPEVRDHLPEIRMKELAQATAVIGYDEVVMLGYRDSGMAGTEANANPESFAQAPLDEAVGRLVAIIRRTKPQVMVIYGDEQSGYPHPDHLRVHEIGIPAFQAAGDPSLFPEAGAAWQPTKLYYTTFSVARFREIHLKFEELGLESPFDETWRARWEGMTEAPITTQVDVSDFGHIRREALLAHATQVDPTSRFWFGLPPEVMDGIHPRDDYQLALVASATDDGVSFAAIDPATMAGPDSIETDLFAGIREPSGARHAR
ncbi:MAG TPA: mycothiol conjugate amidase Mca [Acidimicrobiales bacterium]|nr:mycothiol conjugate amidase Mca [Acidimicrobiales bacterium]